MNPLIHSFIIGRLLNPDRVLSSRHQGVELLVCDLLLTLRTTLWQRGGGTNGEPGPAPASQLAGFQRDLSALRRLGLSYRQAQHKVGSPGPVNQG